MLVLPILLVCDLFISNSMPPPKLELAVSPKSEISIISAMIINISDVFISNLTHFLLLVKNIKIKPKTWNETCTDFL